MFQPGLQFRVAAGDDDQFQRRFDLQDAAEKLFDRPDAESAGKLQDDGPAAGQSQPLAALGPILRPAEGGMDGDAGYGDVAGGHAPVPQVTAPSSVAVK